MRLKERERNGRGFLGCCSRKYQCYNIQIIPYPPAWFPTLNIKWNVGTMAGIWTIDRKGDMMEKSINLLSESQSTSRPRPRSKIQDWPGTPLKGVE
jgi:hypothetical protein